MKKKINNKCCLFVLMSLLILSGCKQDVSNELEAGDSSLADIQQRGKLVVGTYPVIEPMSFVDDSGNVVGFDMDLVNEIASAIGVSVEIKQINFQDLIESAKKKEIDLIACVLTITPERSREILFSTPYFNTGQMIITRKDNNNINGPEDLKEKKVGVQRATTAEKTAMEYVSPPFIVLYDDWNLAPEDLKNGKTEAVLFDIGAFDLVKKNQELKIVGEPLTQEYYGLATNKGNNAFMEEINRILREMKRNGKLEEIENKWLK